MAQRKKGPVSPEAVQLGERIRERRGELGLTVIGLGRLLRTSEGKPVHRTQIWRWETGRDLPHQARWGELAKALQTTVDALFGGIFVVRPDREGTVAEQLVRERDRLDALIGILGLEAAVDAALTSRRADADPADLESAAASLAEAAESQRSAEKGSAKRTRRAGG